MIQGESEKVRTTLWSERMHLHKQYFHHRMNGRQANDEPLDGAVNDTK